MSNTLVRAADRSAIHCFYSLSILMPFSYSFLYDFMFFSLPKCSDGWVTILPTFSMNITFVYLHSTEWAFPKFFLMASLRSVPYLIFIYSAFDHDSFHLEQLSTLPPHTGILILHFLVQWLSVQNNLFNTYFMCMRHKDKI